MLGPELAAALYGRRLHCPRRGRVSCCCGLGRRRKCCHSWAQFGPLAAPVIHCTLDGCGGMSAALPSTGAGACRLLRPRRVRGRVGCSALDGCGGVSAALPSTCEGAGPPGRLPRPRDRGLKRGGGGGVDWLLRARVRCAALDGDWPRHWRSSFQRRAN